MSLGSSNSPGSDPTTATLLKPILTSLESSSSKSRFEMGLQLMSGAAGYDDTDITIPYMFLGRAGYGRALGESTIGTFSLAFGAAWGDFDGDIAGYKHVESDGLMSGMVIDPSYVVNMKTSEAVEIFVGASYMIIAFELDDTKDDRLPEDETITLQIPRAIFGVNVRI